MAERNDALELVLSTFKSLSTYQLLRKDLRRSGITAIMELEDYLSNKTGSKVPNIEKLRSTLKLTETNRITFSDVTRHTVSKHKIN